MVFGREQEKTKHTSNHRHKLNRDLVDRLQSCRRTGTLHDREAGKVLGLYMPLRYAPMLLSDSRTADAA